MQKRNTKSKQMIMNILSDSTSALCHEDIEGQLPEKMDRVTIYRILQGFCDDGKVHKITGENGKTYYALCHNCLAGNHNDNHLHFRCLKCETVSCIDEPLTVPELPSGYSMANITCLISGFCPKCSALLSVILLLFFTQFNLFAQYQIKVADKDTKQAVVAAEVYFLESKTSTITDENGVFSINTKNPAMLVQISFVGYKTFLGTLTPQNESIVFLEPSHFDLQEVVISGNSSKLQGENVANVAKLSLTNNAETQGLSLSQKLAGVAGISNFSTGAGIGKPVIRGLSGNRIAVFSQGIRIENQQWGDEHGLGLDENGYEQVEIIKGPASLLYGSDALGGVLYFSDERYAKENSLESVISSEYNSNTDGWRNTGAFKFSKNRFHWNAFGGYTTHEDYKDGNHDLVPNSRFHTGNFKTSLGYTGNQFISSLKYSFLNEQYGLTEIEENTESVTKRRQPELPYQDLTTHLISSENTVFFDNESKLKVDLGYVFNNRKEFESVETGHAPSLQSETASLDMNLGTLSYNIKWYSPKLNDRWALTAGSQGLYQTNSNNGEELLIPDAVTSDIGLFAMSDYYYSEKSYWQIGLRLDGRHINGKQHGNENKEGYFPVFSETYTAFNFSTGVYQQLAKNFALRANLSSGYRAPNMFELLSNGVHEGTNRYEIGNSALKTENSYQIDISLDYKNEHIELFLNPYFNYIRNYIFLQPAPSNSPEGGEPGSPPSGELGGFHIYYYTQAHAYLYGGETGFHFHPHPLDWLHLEGSYSSAFGENAEQNALPLMPSQKLNATIRASFSREKFLKKFSVYLQNQYSFAQNRVAQYETTTGAYNLLNAGLAFEFHFGKQKILLNAAVNNIFNQKYYDHLSRYKQDDIYNMGRNFTIRLSLPFQYSIDK